jgi:hypothetical protein
MPPAPAHTLQEPAETLFSLFRPLPRAGVQVASLQSSRPPRTGPRIKSPWRAPPNRRQPSRDFVPRRFLDAGRPCMRKVSVLPASKNLYNSGRRWRRIHAGNSAASVCSEAPVIFGSCDLRLKRAHCLLHPVHVAAEQQCGVRFSIVPIVRRWTSVTAATADASSSARSCIAHVGPDFLFKESFQRASERSRLSPLGSPTSGPIQSA